MLVLIAERYRPLTLRRPQLRAGAERIAFAVVPALPALAWAGTMHRLGVTDNFFTPGSGESLGSRAAATLTGIAAHLPAVGPVAHAVMLAECLFLRGGRKRDRFGNPAWLWIAGLGSLTILFIIYLVGKIEIHAWLSSAMRTTTFAPVLLYADIAIRLVIAADGVTKPRKCPRELGSHIDRFLGPERTQPPRVT